MAVSYEKLWNVLNDRNIKKKELCLSAGISHASMAKLGKNENVTTDVLAKVCDALNCDIGDIMEITGLTSTVVANGEKKAQNDQATAKAKPILKWAGGKTQLLKELLPLIPGEYGKYIEPFVGGGALFFAAQPHNAVISDSNPELINVYLQVANNLDALIDCLKTYQNTKEFYYNVRQQDRETLSDVEAAARMIYLNKTCFNGLYRVNRQGNFNVPYGRYKNPKICDEETLRNASKILRKATIECGDYLEILKKYAKPGDFVFLDPPYVPVGEYGDFKRYTKEQFYEKDHENLAKEVARLHELGCTIVLTNSNHPLVHQLYDQYGMRIIPTKRYISCDGKKRTGEDIIVNIPAISKSALQVEDSRAIQQMNKFPATRFMGSKQKLLNNIWDVASKFDFQTVVDLFSGSGAVSYMFKAHGKRVISNDYMYMSATFSKAMIENNSVTLPQEEAESLLLPSTENDHFVEETFRGLYFSDEDNATIDILRATISKIEDPYKKAIAMTALIRACMKKRPRGLFTYTGMRYDDGRRDLKKSMQQQFFEAIDAVNQAVFDNGCQNLSVHGDALAADIENPDLIYIDPPYYSPTSDNEYVRRYHFVEGLARDWKGVELQANTITKKFKSYPTPFSSKDGATEAFDKLFKKYANSIIIVSYSSNGLPTKDEMIGILSAYKENVDVVPIDYTYNFGNQKNVKTHRNKVQEYLFVAH